MVAHEQKAGVMVVTHDQRALDVFDRIFEMEDGALKPSAGPCSFLEREDPKSTGQPSGRI
jgi:ABC-type lipoprotein export system ATPase subunit